MEGRSSDPDSKKAKVHPRATDIEIHKVEHRTADQQRKDSHEIPTTILSESHQKGAVQEDSKSQRPHTILDMRVIDCIGRRATRHKPNERNQRILRRNYLRLQPQKTVWAICKVALERLVFTEVPVYHGAAPFAPRPRCIVIQITRKPQKANCLSAYPRRCSFGHFTVVLGATSW